MFTKSTLIIKANEMYYFSNLFDKVLCMFRTGPLSIMSISTLHTQQLVFVMLVLLAVSILTTLADANRTSMTNTYCMNTVLRYS